MSGTLLSNGDGSRDLVSPSERDYKHIRGLSSSNGGRIPAVKTLLSYSYCDVRYVACAYLKRTA